MNHIQNHIKNTVAAVLVAAALGFVAACGDVEAPANDIGTSVEKKSQTPAPRGPVRDHATRIDFGDGPARLPAKRKTKSWTAGNPSRLDFGDNGRP